MKLTQLAAKPQLIPVTLDDEVIQERYGEALEFYIYDRQDMDTFVKLASMTADNFGDIAKIVKDLILDEAGKPILRDGLTLPNDILMRAVTEVVETLGKQVASPTADKKE